MLAAADPHLPVVEALMSELVRGAADEPAGQIALEHIGSGGKRLRARLALAAAQALGGEAEAAVPWAAACELLHNATLIHDDVEDGDRVRRGRPTAWVRHGVPQAVNAGDLLFVVPFLAIDQLAIAPALRAPLHALLARHAAAVIRGQAAELALTASRRFDRTSYVAAITGKTSALFQLPAEGAALVAGIEPDRALALAPAFARLGLLFQVQDDVLDLFGDKGRGEVGADLREGKISALVVEHLALHPQDAPWLLGLLALPRDATPEAEVRRAIAAFADGGALAAASRWIRQIEASLVAAPELAAYPRLQSLAAELVEAVLGPIRGALR